MSEAVCPVDIPFADVQGNILTGYGRQGFPFGRFGLVCVRDAAKGRAFVEALRNRVTTGARWESKRKPGLAVGRVEVKRPKVAINLAFTFYGLVALGVPTRTLRGLPDEFIDGMALRCDILGDDTPENPRSAWDPVWLPEHRRDGPHILVMLNAQDDGTGNPVSELAETCREIEGLCSGAGAARRPSRAGSALAASRGASRFEREALRQGAFRLYRRHQRPGLPRPICPVAGE
jgi:hypothetical protein